MSEIPKELIPIVVVLWMNMHTAKRRGILSAALCSCELTIPCPQCGNPNLMSLRIALSGAVEVYCLALGCSFEAKEHILSLMPSATDGVGIADFPNSGPRS